MKVKKQKNLPQGYPGTFGGWNNPPKPKPKKKAAAKKPTAAQIKRKKR